MESLQAINIKLNELDESLKIKDNKVHSLDNQIKKNNLEKTEILKETADLKNKIKKCEYISKKKLSNLELVINENKDLEELVKSLAIDIESNIFHISDIIHSFKIKIKSSKGFLEQKLREIISISSHIKGNSNEENFRRIREERAEGLILRDLFYDMELEFINNQILDEEKKKVDFEKQLIEFVPEVSQDLHGQNNASNLTVNPWYQDLKKRKYN